MAYDRQKVIDIALAEVDYLEKETNSNLDSKTGNAGDENFTKYARDLAAVKFFNSNKQGKAWCATFVAWCVHEAFGKEAALKLLCQPTKDNCGAGCEYIYRYFKAKKQWHTSNPQAGDVIVFWDSKKKTRSHTGWVYKVDGSKVYTVEGNTSGASGVIDNGGGVFRKSYSLSYTRIAGYGRPDWGMEYKAENTTISTPETPATPTEYKLGDRTLKKLSPYMQGADVTDLQTRLNALGFDCGKADGKFGSNTEKAVKAFQKAAGIEVDGKFGKESFKALNTFKPDTTAPAAYENYTVKKGDSLWTISKKHLGSGPRYKEIMQLNGLKSALVRVGQNLKLPKK